MMPRRTILILALSISLAITFQPVFATAQGVTMPDDPLKGRELFFAKGCIKCHSIRQEGGTIGPDLGRAGANRDVTRWAAAMWNHYPNMRKKMIQHGISFPLFTSNEMAELIAYIYFVGYFDNPPADADRRNGKTLFRAKGCADCHSLGGEGGGAGPDLTGWKKFVSPVLWARIMWNHSLRWSRKSTQKGAPPPRFVSDEMGDLVAYIYDTGDPAQGETVYSLPGNPARGGQLFVEKSCIQCHSVLGKGGNTGPPLSIGRRHRSAMQFAGMMWNHSQAMPEGMKRDATNKLILTGAEMADLTAYLFLIGYFDELGDMAAGEQVFKDKGCIMCHKIGGAGGDRGPELTRYREQGESLQPVFIAQAMWNHAPLMAAAMEEKSLPWPRFNGKEMANLLAYIRGRE